MAKIAIVPGPNEDYETWLRRAFETQGHEIVGPVDADIAVIVDPKEGDVGRIASVTEAPIIVVST